MKRNVYYSCNCQQCRWSPSGVKRDHKRAAHKRFRYQGRRDPENIAPVSTGYKA